MLLKHNVFNITINITTIALKYETDANVNCIPLALQCRQHMDCSLCVQCRGSALLHSLPGFLTVLCKKCVTEIIFLFFVGVR